MIVYVLSQVPDDSLPELGEIRLSDVYGVYATLEKAQENAAYAELVALDELEWERLTQCTWGVWYADGSNSTWFVDELTVQGLTP